MNTYTIPKSFANGRTAIHVTDLNELHDFIKSCEMAGLNTNRRRTEAFFQDHYRKGYFYLLYGKPVGFRQVVVYGTISVCEKANGIPASELMIDDSETCESILSLL